MSSECLQPCPGSGSLLLQAGQRGAGPGDRRHRGAPLGQLQRDLPANAAAGSGHDRDLPSQGRRRHHVIMTGVLAPATQRLADARYSITSRSAHPLTAA